MAKKQNGKHEQAPEQPAADSPEPVAVPVSDGIVRDKYGRIIVGPVIMNGVRYEAFPHDREHALTIDGRECHHVGDDGDARIYRPFV